MKFSLQHRLRTNWRRFLNMTCRSSWCVADMRSDVQRGTREWVKRRKMIENWNSMLAYLCSWCYGTEQRIGACVLLAEIVHGIEIWLSSSEKALNLSPITPAILLILIYLLLVFQTMQARVRWECSNVPKESASRDSGSAITRKTAKTAKMNSSPVVSITFQLLSSL